MDKCEECGEDGDWCNDPFEEEMNDRIVEVCLCADCYLGRIGDI